MQRLNLSGERIFYFFLVFGPVFIGYKRTRQTHITVHDPNVQTGRSACLLQLFSFALSVVIQVEG